MAVEPLDKDTEKFFNSGGEVEDGQGDGDTGDDEQGQIESSAGAGSEQDAEAHNQTENDGGEEGEQRRPRGDLRAALHEARQESRALKERLLEHERYREETDRKLQIIGRHLQGQQTQKGDQDPEPDREDDPFGHLQWENRRLSRQVQALSDRAQRGDQMSVHAQAARRFTNMVTSDEARFARENKDYDGAAEFLRSRWADEFRDSGIPEHEISQALVRRGAELSLRALQNRRSPAETIYNLAKKFGYSASNGDSGDEGVQKLRRQEEGQRLESRMRGRGDETTLSLASVEKMSEEELEERLSDPKFWKTVQRATA